MIDPLEALERADFNVSKGQNFCVVSDCTEKGNMIYYFSTYRVRTCKNHHGSQNISDAVVEELNK